MLTTIIVLQCAQILLLIGAAILAWRADRLVAWCEAVILPWMVKIASLLHDDYNPPG